MAFGKSNPNSRRELAWEAMCEDFEDELAGAEEQMEALRDALNTVLTSNDIEARFRAAIDITNLLNPDGEYTGAKHIERTAEQAFAAIQERIP